MRERLAGIMTKPEAPLVAALACVLAFVAILFAAFLVGDAPVPAADKIATTISDMPGITVFSIIAIIAWALSAEYRCTDLFIRRVMLYGVVLLVLWIACTVVDATTTSPAVSEAARCVSAIPVAFMPAGFVISAVHLVATKSPKIEHAVATCVLCAAAAGAVALMVSGVHTGPYVIIVAPAIVLAMELGIDLGVFPSIRQYRILFNHLPFDLKILNRGGQVVYRTQMSKTLDATTLWRLASRMPSRPEATIASVRSTAVPGSVFKLYRISAGTALLTEDSSELDSMQDALEQRQQLLTNQNEVLRRNHELQSLLYRQQREQELGARVERDLAATAAQIKYILDHRINTFDSNMRKERVQQLNLVKVLVAYSKRKGMLALASAESDSMDRESLDLIMREAMADLHSIGIECAALVNVSGPVPMSAVNTIYDCFYDCIIGVLTRANPVVMVFINGGGDKPTDMRLAIECAIGIEHDNALEKIPQIATSTDTWTSLQMDIAHELDGRLATRDANYEIEMDEGLVNVSVHADAEPGNGAGGFA